MNNNYFIWEGDPVMLNLGELILPFPVSIPGLILAVVIIFVLPGYLVKDKNGDKRTKHKKRRKRAKDQAEQSHKPDALSGWQTAGIIAGSLLMGQLLFLFLPGPTIGQIGPIMLRWYGVLFASAFIIGYLIGRKLFQHAGKDVALADKLLTYIVVATIIGARLGHVIFYDFDYYIRNLHEILYIWQGGLASHGATVAIMIALWLFMRNHPGITFFWLTDRLTIPVILGGSFIRLGNFFNSEIYGLPASVPWAVVFTRIDMLPRHPTMLYEAAIGIAILILLIAIYRYYRNHPPEGLLTGVLMVTLFTSRILVEYTKVEQAPFTETWFLGMGQLLSVPFVVFGIWILWKKVKWSGYPEISTEKK